MQMREPRSEVKGKVLPDVGYLVRSLSQHANLPSYLNIQVGS
jgi:hypothetical protein